MNLDLATFMVGVVGVVGAMLSLVRATQEYKACIRIGVNGATKLTTKAAIIKNLMFLIAQAIFTERAFVVAADPRVNFAVETSFAVLLLTAITIYDGYYNHKLVLYLKNATHHRRRLSD